MRSLLCVVGLAAMFVVPPRAAAQDLSWGLKGGLVFGSLDTSGANAFETSPDAGGVFGGFVAVDLGDRFRFQPELLWSVRRFAATDTPTPFSVSARGLEIPLLVQARFPRARARQVIVFAGPQIGFIGKVTQKVGTVRTEISELLETADVAVLAGAGLDLALGTGSIVIDLRTVVGTRNLSTNTGASQKSRAVSILVGYRF